MVEFQGNFGASLLISAWNEYGVIRFHGIRQPSVKLNVVPDPAKPAAVAPPFFLFTLAPSPLPCLFRPFSR
jgi:hypothetical protein